MVLWSVRVVLAGKGLSLYDIMVRRDDGCTEKDNTWLAISKELWRFDNYVQKPEYNPRSGLDTISVIFVFTHSVNYIYSS